VMDLVAALNLIYRYQGDARGYTSFSFFINLRRLIVLSGSTMNLRRMARIKTRFKYMSSWDCEQRNDLGLNDRSIVSQIIIFKYLNAVQSHCAVLHVRSLTPAIVKCQRAAPLFRHTLAFPGRSLHFLFNHSLTAIVIHPCSPLCNEIRFKTSVIRVRTMEGVVLALRQAQRTLV